MPEHFIGPTVKSRKRFLAIHKMELGSADVFIGPAVVAVMAEAFLK